MWGQDPCQSAKYTASPLLLEMQKKTSGQRISNAKKVTKTADIITATPAAVERDCQLGVCELAGAHDQTYGTL
jgi:hypothetical protein